MRVAKLIPAVALRRTTREVNLGQFKLPKGTKINYVPALVMNDERVCPIPILCSFKFMRTIKTYFLEKLSSLYPSSLQALIENGI